MAPSSCTVAIHHQTSVSTICSVHEAAPCARAAFPLQAVQQFTLVPVLQVPPVPVHQEPVEPKLQLPLLPEVRLFSVSELQPFLIPQEPARPSRRLTPLPAAFRPPPQVFNLHHPPAHFHQYSCLSAKLLPHQSPNLLQPVVQPPEQLCTLGKPTDHLHEGPSSDSVLVSPALSPLTVNQIF